MFIRLIIAILISGLSSSVASKEVAAGPVERELRLRAADVTIPVQRPVDKREFPSLPKLKKAETSAPEITVETPQPAFDEACFVKLSKTAFVSRASPPISKDPQCVIPSPVILHRTLGGRSVKFTDGLLLDCNFARQYAGFSSTTLQKLAKKHLNAGVTELHSGQGFVCRRRNNRSTGKLSEHAFGNALDLLGFKFNDGSSLNIRKAVDMPARQADFFNSLREASCGAFTTVLGPGSNPAHATHLHLDLGRSKENPNPYRICE